MAGGSENSTASLGLFRKNILPLPLKWKKYEAQVSELLPMNLLARTSLLCEGLELPVK